MLGNLQNRVTIVTGAGQGIGEGIAKTFAAAGARVVVATRTIENGQETVDDITAAGGNALLIQADVGSKSEVNRVVEATVAHYGRLDIVVHNAAVFPIAPVVDMSEDDLESALAVNLKPAFWFTQAAVPHMKNQGKGRLLFTSSVTGPTVAMPGTAAYAASKGGMNAFIRTAALELARHRITVNGIEPGYILTQAMSLIASEEELKEMATMIPDGNLGKPEDIAHAMLFLASDEAAYITGQTLVVDGGSTLPESPVVLRQYYEEQGH